MRGGQQGVMLAQERTAISKPAIALGLCQSSRAPSPPLFQKNPPLYLEGTQPAFFAVQLHFWHVESQALLLTSLLCSPHIMGQEGPRQPHSDHQEEADKDKTGIHSCRCSEKRGTEDHGRGEVPFLGKCAVMSHSGGSRKGGWKPRRGTRKRS